MKTKMIANLSMLAFVGAASSAYAGVAPDSYDMLNGNTGSYNYWDETYNGSGCVTCDNAALSGGRGDLTDGIIATETGLSPKRRWATVLMSAGPSIR